MDRLRVAVVGLGNMGRVHATNVAKLSNACLHAVASRRPEVTREVAARFNAERFYTDYDRLFRDPDLDAVVIATGIIDHPEHIIQAAQNGLPIFTEKPIASRLCVSRFTHYVLRLTCNPINYLTQEVTQCLRHLLSPKV
jgi:predicted dehydrogenase